MNALRLNKELSDLTSTYAVEDKKYNDEYEKLERAYFKYDDNVDFYRGELNFVEEEYSGMINNRESDQSSFDDLVDETKELQTAFEYLFASLTQLVNELKKTSRKTKFQAVIYDEQENF